jgi:DNA-directed RNA polymerase sigma subunit (sigma70/sigma32)
MKIQNLDKDDIRNMLSILSEREQEIMKLRLDIDNKGYSLTLEEVGLYFNLTRERIRQIEAKALRRIRSLRHKERDDDPDSVATDDDTGKKGDKLPKTRNKK